MIKIYKFNSYFFQISEESTTIERSTYSLLDWLGDVGGLFDGLKLILSSMVVSISSFAIRNELLSMFFKSDFNNYPESDSDGTGKE